MKRRFSTVTDGRLTFLVWMINAGFVTANVALYIYLASIVNARTGSVFLSSIVFALQWVAPVALGGFMPGINARAASRTVLNVAIASAALLLLALPWVDRTVIPFLLTLCLGGLELAVKVTRLVLLKELISEGRLARTVAITSTGQFVGAALGGLVFALAMSRSDTWFVTVLLFSYAVALMSTLLLPRREARRVVSQRTDRRPSVLQGVRAIADDPLLLRAVVGLVATTGLLQGFHNIARIELPVRIWEAGDTGVGALQSVAAVSTVAGALLFTLGPTLFVRPVPLVLLTAGSATAMCIATAPVGLAWGAAVYALYFVLFEVCFMANQATISTRSSVQQISSVISAQFIAVNAALAVLVTSGGALAERAGLTITAGVLGGSCLAVVLWCARRGGDRSRARKPTSSGDKRVTERMPLDE